LMSCFFVAPYIISTFLPRGQRQGDLLTLPWSAYDGQWIRLRQGKTGRRVNVPVTRRLRTILDNTKRTDRPPTTHCGSYRLPRRSHVRS